MRRWSRIPKGTAQAEAAGANHFVAKPCSSGWGGGCTTMEIQPEREFMLLNRVRPFSTAICLVLCSCVWMAAQAQNPPAPPPAQSQQSQPPANEEPLQTFTSEVNVVNLFYNVKDKHGMLIPNLTKDDFSVLEDGKPQTIKYFSAESNQPLTLGIMIDTSASQTRVLTIEQEACAEFLRQVLRQKDLAFVINFDTDVNLDQDFTNN